QHLSCKPSLYWYCLGPVTVSLLFPPLANGIDAVVRLPAETKGILRLWGVRRFRRSSQIYVPAALKALLTGLRASATWAGGATVITEGMLGGVDTNDSASTLGHILLRPFSGPAGQASAVVIVTVVLGMLVYAAAFLFQILAERAIFGTILERERTYPIQEW